MFDAATGVRMCDRATLRLFNAIQVNEKGDHQVSAVLLSRTIRNGYILDPNIHAEESTLLAIESVIGISGEKANSAFHKSWSVVHDSSMEELVTQQMLHYITTYGFQYLGIYSRDTVFIPHEVLEVPELQDNLPLVVIKAMDPDTILANIIKLGSGIALSCESLQDMMTIVTENKYDVSLINKIANWELRTLLYDFYGVAPTEPTEFLRYVIRKLTGDSLLIKNDALIEKIKASQSSVLDGLIPVAPPDLASIFHRFKPLFLAMKSISGNKRFFNRLRKKAVKLHRPLPDDYLNSITKQIKNKCLNPRELQDRLKGASIFRKVRLAYALNSRVNAGDSIVYRIRNGKGWAVQFDWPADLLEITENALQTTIDSIVADLRKKVSDLTIYIPENVHYTLPATEKQFTGNWPTGSYIVAPEDLIVGIHWLDTMRSIDLDLSVIGESGKLGWDSEYRSEDRQVLFSGDMTEAPHPLGATELFYFKHGDQEAKIMMVNYFNFIPTDPVDCKILVAHESPDNFGMNYMVDPNNILATANITIEQKQNVLGIIVHVDGQNRIYFANISIGTSITAANNEHSTYARNYLVNSMVNALELGSILRMAGAIVVCQRPSHDDYVDLSPVALNKATIIDLLR